MPIFDLFWSMLWFFLLFIWIWLVISILADVFRSEVSGLAKAGWALFIIVLPIFGCLIYLIINGSKMHERSIKAALQMEQAQRSYIREAAGTGSSGTADELVKLAQLKDQGVLTDQEFQAQKAKRLA